MQQMTRLTFFLMLPTQKNKRAYIFCSSKINDLTEIGKQYSGIKNVLFVRKQKLTNLK